MSERNIIRPDESGAPDDVVLTGVDVHLERMNDGAWSLICYRQNAGRHDRIHFSIESRSGKAAVDAVLLEDDFGCVDDRRTPSKAAPIPSEEADHAE